MTSNPMLRSNVYDEAVIDSKPMTVQGTVNKTLMMLVVLVISGYFTWDLCAKGFSDKVNFLMITSLIGGFILAIFTAFKPMSSKYTTPAYAICEGMLLGAISYAYNAMTQGIVLNAILLTLLAFFAMLFAYKTKLLQATPTFKKVIVISTAAIAIFYSAGLIGALFGHPMTIFNGDMTGIIVSAVICVIAALNFILDFDFVERAANTGAPDTLEWYGTFSMLVTLVWLYMEVLRLLAQLSKRN